MNAWHLSNLSVSFTHRRGTVHALRQVDLSIKKGVTTGIMGQSGCGKSTLLRVLAGLIPPTSGEVNCSLSRHCGALSFVFQAPQSSLTPHRTVAQLLAEPLKLARKLDKKEREEAVDEILGLLDLPLKLKGQKPHTLSGGQAQRVALGRALAFNPQALLLDEPCGSLDTVSAALVMEALKKVTQKEALTTLFVSHDPRTLGELCQELIVMVEGRIVERGSASDVLSRPKHPFTAQLCACIPPLRPETTAQALLLNTTTEGCPCRLWCPRQEEACQVMPPLSDEVHAAACWSPLR